MLVLALAAPIYAGEMGNGVASPPPQTQTQTTTPTATPSTDDAADGEMGNGIAATATEAALSLLETLLAII